MLKTLVSIALSFFVLTTAHVASAEKLTPAGFAAKQLNLDSPSDKPLNLLKDGKAPQFGYLSASVGAFTLDGSSGQASFIYNHDLDVDWHAHTMSYVGVGRDSDGNKYWFYQIADHANEYLAFSQDQAQGFPDEGYRVFYIHVDNHEAHFHLVAWDAKRLPYHKHH